MIFIIAKESLTCLISTSDHVDFERLISSLPCKYAELHPGAHCTKHPALISMQTCRASTRHQVHKIQQKCRTNYELGSRQGISVKAEVI
jgi:hypothetical protein